MNINLQIKPKGVLSGHTACITKIVFSEDEDYILSSSLDNQVCLWNVNKQLHINTYKDVHKRGINDIALFRDNTKFFSAGNDPYAYLWDTLSNNILNRINVNDKINSIRLSTNEKLLFCTKSNLINVYDFKEKDYKKKNTPLQTFNDANDVITDIFVTEFEVYSCSTDNILRCYDLRMGKMMDYDLKSPILGIDVTNDGEYFCASLIDNSIKLVEKNSGLILGLYKGDINNSHRRNIKLDRKNKYIFCCSHKNEFVVYDVVKSNTINNMEFWKNLEWEPELDIYKNTYYKIPIGKPTYYLNINKNALAANAYIDRDKYNTILNKHKVYGKKKINALDENADLANINNLLVCGDVNGDIHVLQLYYVE